MNQQNKLNKWLEKHKNNFIIKALSKDYENENNAPIKFFRFFYTFKLNFPKNILTNQDKVSFIIDKYKLDKSKIFIKEDKIIFKKYEKFAINPKDGEIYKLNLFTSNFPYFLMVFFCVIGQLLFKG